MVTNVSHVMFDRATTNAKVDDEEKCGATNAIDLTNNNAFIGNVGDNNNQEITLECHCDNPVNDEIDILEIAFHKGKLRKTKFAVDYLDTDYKKHHVGTYESAGNTNNYEKFLMPQKVKGMKGLVITFKGNNDRSPWFAVKGIRLAKFVEKTL